MDRSQETQSSGKNMTATHFLRSRESNISRCFSLNANLTLSPASSSSSCTIWVIGFQSSLGAGTSTRDVPVGAGPESFISALMACFWMSINRFPILRITLTNKARDWFTGSWSSAFEGQVPVSEGNNLRGWENRGLPRLLRLSFSAAPEQAKWNSGQH